MRIAFGDEMLSIQCLNAYFVFLPWLDTKTFIADLPLLISLIGHNLHEIGVVSVNLFLVSYGFLGRG